MVIIVDTASILEEYRSLTERDINVMLDNIAKGLANRFAEELINKAESELKRTRQRYIDNVRVIDTGKLEGTVVLDYSKDKLIKMIEEGASAFDMKEGFLASPKAKIGKNGGKYITIPYRQATPGAIAENNAFAFRMSYKAYKIAKAKPLTIQVSGGGLRSAGIAYSELPAALQELQKRPAIVSPSGVKMYNEYVHRSPINQGITKYQDSVTGQNTYRSFRRVSENSDPEAFIHPGIQAHNLINKALSGFGTESNISELLDNELSRLNLL